MTIHLLTVAGLSMEIFADKPAGLWTVYKPAMFRGRILKDSSVLAGIPKKGLSPPIKDKANE